MIMETASNIHLRLSTEKPKRKEKLGTFRRRKHKKSEKNSVRMRWRWLIRSQDEHRRKRLIHTGTLMSVSNGRVLDKQNWFGVRKTNVFLMWMYFVFFSTFGRERVAWFIVMVIDWLLFLQHLASLAQCHWRFFSSQRLPIDKTLESHRGVCVCMHAQVEYPEKSVRPLCNGFLCSAGIAKLRLCRPHFHFDMH